MEPPKTVDEVSVRKSGHLFGLSLNFASKPTGTLALIFFPMCNYSLFKFISFTYAKCEYCMRQSNSFS